LINVRKKTNMHGPNRERGPVVVMVVVVVVTCSRVAVFEARRQFRKPEDGELHLLKPSAEHWS
jgi:hypothetical protein